MALAKWSASDGVAFSKKHDAPLHNQHTHASRSSWGGFRRRRTILVIVALLALFLFIKNIPTDVVPVAERYNTNFGSLAPGHVLAHHGSQQNNNHAGTDQSGRQQYEGSVSFRDLAVSLRPHLSWTSNKNVLFASTELASTSNLMPVACQMAQNNRTSVHVALLGRQEIKIKDIMSINGISAEDCPIFWHDARPDHPRESSWRRIEAAVQSGFAHCCTALRPQIALVDDLAGKDSVVNRLLSEVAAGTGVPLIILPGNVHRSLPWITALDSGSIRKLNEVEIEIVVQAYSESAGPLMRLLRSIEAANYRGLFIPRLTIELPTQIDPFLSNYLAGFRWPPGSASSESKLVLRHQVYTRKARPAEASLRTVESFYPRAGSVSHLLLLSPDAELSSDYLQYLMFTLLEYKYGQDNEDVSASLFGISLELPDRSLDGQSPFLIRTPSEKEPFVMSQAPNSNAVLIMGDKWMELHNFLGRRLSKDPDLTQTQAKRTSVSEKHPQWLREALDLMQARGQYILYPAFATAKGPKLVTLHQELHQSPEEYAQVDADQKVARPIDADRILQNDVLTGDLDLPTRNDNILPLKTSLPLEVLLAANGKDSNKVLPRLSDILLFTSGGRLTDWSESRRASAKFGNEFSLSKGGCTSLEARNKADKASVDSLFCDIG